MAPSLSTAKPPSTRDIISWQQEEAHRLGLLGFSTNFPNPSDIFQPISLQRSAQIAPDTDDAAVAVAAAMQQTHNALYLLHHRRSIMDAHRAAVSRTELDVDAKLLAEGMSKLYVARHGLREKLVALVECKQPRAEKNFVTVQVQPRGVNGWIELALPLKATMAEVNQLLGEVVSAEMARLREWMKEDGGEGRRGGWKYQLLSHDRSRVVSHRSVELETDADFTRLSLILDDGCGKARPVAVLTQEGPALSEVANTAVKARDVNATEDWEECVEEVLDDEGNPYFEPLDWKVILKKYGGKEDVGDQDGVTLL